MVHTAGREELTAVPDRELRELTDVVRNAVSGRPVTKAIIDGSDGVTENEDERTLADVEVSQSGAG